MLATGCRNPVQDTPLLDLPCDSGNVVAFYEGRWVLANWTGTRWLSDGAEITAVERWLPCGRPWNWNLGNDVTHRERS